MTTIIINKNYIEVKGHSGYASSGSDIVCAAISTLVESTYNYLSNLEYNVDLEERDGYFKIIFLGKLSEVQEKIVSVFTSMVENLIKQYPDYLERG